MHNENNDGPSSDEEQSPGAADPYSGVEGFESPQGPDDDGHPLADNQFDVNAFVDVVKLTFERLKGTPILIALVGVSVVSLLWGLFSGGTQFIAYFVMDDFGAGLPGIFLMILGIILYPLLILVAVVQTTLYRPASRAVFEGSIDLEEPLDVIKSTTDLILPVGAAVVVLGITGSLGAACCLIPGVIIYFLFGQAPYLIATRDRGIIEAFTESAQRSMEHWHIMAMALGMNFVIVAMLSVLIGCVLALSAVLGPLGLLAQPVITWLASTLMIVIGLIIFTAAFSTIDELEGIETIQR